jgi:CheY-like chemotaxis protein
MIKDISYIADLEEAERKKVIAEKALQFKNKFLANMSHEIRTPMTAIMGISELLLDTPLNQQQKDFVKIIRETSFNLKEIINDILDLSKLEAGKMEMHYFKVGLISLLENIKTIFSTNIKSKGLQLEYSIHPSCPAYLITDNVRINQVLINLVNNAIKFTPEGEVTIEVKSKLINEFQTEIKFSIIDTGIGISLEDQEKLFKYFSHLTNCNDITKESSGLGLQICKLIVETMKGKIGVISSPQRGSTFWFTVISDINNYKENFVETPIKYLPYRNEINYIKHILLVDDNLLNLKVIGLLLEKAHHKYTVAHNGQEAVDLFLKHDFDIILMDIEMPLMNGIEATQKIKSFTNKLCPPIIGLSGNAMEGFSDQYIQQGMDDYLEKPISFNDLNNKIIQWINKIEKTKT